MTKISQIAVTASSVSATDKFELETSGGISKQVLASKIKSYVNGGDGYTVYRALISQNAPIASQTSGVFLVGQIWTITTFNAYDDFSNMELISGTMNTSGCVFRATSTTPTAWGSGSDLAYDGRPYIVSTDVNSNIVPFVTTIGDIAFSYTATGQFKGTLANAFLQDKTQFKIAFNFVGVPVIYWSSVNEFILLSKSNLTTYADNLYNYTALDIYVYP